MAISFDLIPANLRVPGTYVEFSSRLAQQGAVLQPYQILVIGQRTTGGTVAELEPTVVTEAEQAKTYFGDGSMLHGMARALFANNRFTKAVFVALDDADGSTASVRTITFTGTATAAGTVHLMIAGQEIKVGVASGDAAADVAAAAQTAIAANTSLPFTATVNAGVVTLTAKNKGTVASSLDLRHSYYTGQFLPAGIGCSFSQTTPGATDPDLDDVWAVLGDEHYNVIVTPYTDASNLGKANTELVDRWGPMRAIEGVAFAASNVSHSNLLTLGDSLNSPHLCVVGAFGSPTPTYEVAAAVAGIVAFYGNADPARPFQYLPVAGVLAPKETDRFTANENNLLLFDGISTLQTAADGTVQIQRLVTTYQTNAAGAADTAFLDLTTPLTLGYLRYDFRTYFRTKYQRFKLGDDGKRYGPGQAIMTPGLARAECRAKFDQWEELGLVEDPTAFTASLIVERDSIDPNRLNIAMQPNLINGFRVLATQMAFVL